MKNDSIDISIIWKKINGKLSAEEQSQLSDWLDEDPAHRAYFDKAVNYYQQKKQSDSNSEVSGNPASDLPKQEITPKKKSGIYWIAASLLLLIGSTVAYVISTLDEPKPQVIAQKIAPGTDKAILITSNGSTITLDHAAFSLNNGDESVESDGSTLAYKKNETVDYSLKNTLMIPAGGKYNLVLADGTKVYLNSETKLTFPVAFRGERIVQLEGEAFFEVAKGTHPFIVKTTGPEIKVLGTHFNVTAYDNEANVTTTLVEGKVNVETADHQVMQLLPGDQSVYEYYSGTMEKRQVDVTLFTGWVQNLFVFEDQDLDEIMKTLSRWYNVKVIFTDPNKKKLKFTGEMDRYEEIETLLHLIEKTNAVEFEIKDYKVFVK